MEYNQLEIRQALERVLVDNDVKLDNGVLVKRNSLTTLVSEELGISRKKAKQYIGITKYLPNSILLISTEHLTLRIKTPTKVFTYNPWSALVSPDLLKDDIINFEERMSPRNVVHLIQDYATAVSDIGDAVLRQLVQVLDDENRAEGYHYKISNIFNSDYWPRLEEDQALRVFDELGFTLYKSLLAPESFCAFGRLLEFVFLPTVDTDVDRIIKQSEDLSSVYLQKVPDKWTVFRGQS